MAKANEMKYSYCPVCGNTQLREIIVKKPSYSLNKDEPKLLQPAVIRIYCPGCQWREEYKEES